MSLVLRRVKPADAAAIAEQFADPDVFGGTLQLPYPSEELWAQRIAGMNPPAAGSNEMVLAAVLDDKAVGLAGLHPVGPAVRRRHAMSLGITVAKASQGQGVGNALMAALIDYADNWAQILRIELTVYHDNQRAIRLYERHGFAPEGRLKAYGLRNGVYEDVLAMARLHPRQPMVRGAGD
ncbi:GNAT family N-acetyltransferase [Pelomonas aquatica]|jgi:putative acetyltransferase|uniref:GNAT family N-acetyltransferase n=1 Tax=Pelomonas aquatica TaxID=431058 RepID=A0A9X4R6M9_9BURK|nr:GNAT family N-acetyltransferase [Pelomonas aquatica]MCY4753652.1 GNAT family N-acetyltransferase [Pelomonas aquatica]MDG0864990.1 GNAT family N-acetyltransferase [Pelomonas aquatica]